MNLRFWLGLIPDTTRLEEKMIALEREYNQLLSFHETVTWKRYEELEQEVKSSAFHHKIEAIKQLKFEHSPEHARFVEWQNLKASESLRTFFKVKKSDSLARFQSFETSENPKRVAELETILASKEFQAAKELPKSEFHASEYFAYQKEYKHITESGDYKFWASFKQSDKYKTYLKMKDSKEYHQFLELEAYVNSEEFKKKKEYLSLPAKKKVEQADEYHIIQEHSQMAGNEEIKWYLASRNHARFDWHRKWQLVFSDEFKADKLDTDKWLTRYFYGDAILGQSYSLASDYHYVSEGKNIEVKSDVCSIVTRNEKATGNAWNPAFGFIPKEFTVTSGLINSGKSFRSKYGIIQAKVCFNGSHPITHAFWLASNQSLPQVDVFKFENNKFIASNYYGSIAEPKKDGVKLSSSKLANGYWIVELEWAPNLLIWRVNGLEVQRLTQNIPSEDMYLVFSSGLYADQAISQSVNFDIDWVRWYQERK